jgi:hypothetical protein
MTFFQSITNRFHKIISKLNKDDEDRPVFGAEEGAFELFLARRLDEELNRPTHR